MTRKRDPMRACVVFLGSVIFFALCTPGHDLAVAAEQSEPLKEDLKSLQGRWVRAAGKGDKEAAKVDLSFKKDSLTLFVEGRSAFAAGTAAITLRERDKKRFISATKGLDTSTIRYTIKGDSLTLDGTIRIVGLGKHDLTGSWKRKKK